MKAPRTTAKAATMRVADWLKLGIENLLIAEVVADEDVGSVTRGCKGKRGNECKDCSGWGSSTLISVAVC